MATSRPLTPREIAALTGTWPVGLTPEADSTDAATALQHERAHRLTEAKARAEALLGAPLAPDEEAMLEALVRWPGSEEAARARRWLDGLARAWRAARMPA